MSTTDSWSPYVQDSHRLSPIVPRMMMAGFLCLFWPLADSFAQDETGWQNLLSPPGIEDVQLTSASGQNLPTDDLTCSYTLTGDATTSATAWYRNNAPIMRLYLPMEGGSVAAARDYSGSNLTLTPGSDPAWLATAGHDGRGAFEFDGNDDFNAGENFPTNSSYTLMAWVYRTGSGNNGGNNIIAGNDNNGGHAFWAPDMYGNKLSAGHNGTWNSVQDTVALALNTWFHVALTYDTGSKQMVLYKNGNPIKTATVTAAVTDATISVGSFGASNGYMWKGYLDDVRIYVRALTPEQIASLHTVGQDVLKHTETATNETWQCKVTPFSGTEAGTTQSSNTLTIAPNTPPVSNLLLSSTSGLDLTTDDLTCTYTLPGVATTAASAWYRNAAPLMRLYLPMEGGATTALRDCSGNASAVTANGSPVWLPTGGHDGHGAFEFNGNNDLAGGEGFPVNASYSKVAWVYRTGSGRNGGNNIIAGNQDPGGHAFWAPDMYSNKLSAGHNGTWNSVQDSVALALNTWYHVALTYDFATKQMILYKNGSPISSATVTAPVTDTTISIGSFGYSNGWMWKGKIDDARVYARTLSPEQVASLYSVGRDVIVAAETEVGDQWQCRVTPFAADEAGPTSPSNLLTIVACEAPVITDQPDDQTTIPGGTAEFTIAATGTGTLTCRWQKNSGVEWLDLSDGGHCSGSGTATLTVSDADTDDVASYRCRVTGPCGSVTSNEATLVLAPVVTGWASVGVHGGTAGEQSIPIVGEAPVSEPRRNGLHTVTVTFNETVTPTDGLLDPADVIVTDHLGGTYAPAALLLDGGPAGTILSIAFDSPLPESMRYTFELAGAFRSAASGAPLGGRTSCQICKLVGDVNNDNTVDLTDMAAVKVHKRRPVGSSTAIYDVNGDGAINLIDVALMRPRYGNTGP